MKRVLSISLLACFLSCLVSCDLFDDGDDDMSKAVVRPATTLAEAGTVMLEFEQASDLDWFYFFDDEYDDDIPEWDQEEGAPPIWDPYYIRPVADNSEEENRADAALLLDLGPSFDFYYIFQMPSDTDGYTGPNLSFRYAYDEDDHPQAGVITVMMRERPSEADVYELLVDRYEPSAVTNYVGGYETIDQPTADTWYKIEVFVRDGSDFTVNLYHAESSILQDTVTYSFFPEDAQSFYNPSLWAYADTGNPGSFNNGYIIGTMRAALPTL